jgi:hypothetical protein
VTVLDGSVYVCYALFFNEFIKKFVFVLHDNMMERDLGEFGIDWRVILKGRIRLCGCELNSSGLGWFL